MPEMVVELVRHGIPEVSTLTLTLNGIPEVSTQRARYLH